MNDAILIHDTDDVLVALRDLKKGETVNGILLKEDIPQAHKIARRALKKGAPLHKYGNVIGILTRDVEPGEWIHSDELKTSLSDAPVYRYEKGTVSPKEPSDREFLGFPRESGKVGTRNDLLILPTVGCVNGQARAIREGFLARHPEMARRVKIASHPYGCSQLGEDHAHTACLLSGIAHNPNFGGVLALGLGCENNRMETFYPLIADLPSHRLRVLVGQEVEDEIEAGIEKLEELYAFTKEEKRVPCPLSKIALGLKCGGSDGFSGLTANPMLGYVSEVIGGAGGQVALTEVPEMFGAEQSLMNRAKDEETFHRIVGLIENFKAYYAKNGQPCYENPSPGNKDGGITTLEEKSSGCVLKAGHLEVEDVLDYGDSLKSPGLSLLNGPGNDIVASTNCLAAGCNILCFTTGRGTPFGSLIPTIKVATNHRLAAKKPSWIDFDAEAVLEEGFLPVRDRFLDLLCDIASGKETKAEILGMDQIALFKEGVTL